MAIDRMLIRTRERETQQLLDLARTLFSFDLSAGKIWWKVKPAVGVKIGDEAGSLMGKGYRSVRVGGQCVLVHRLIWALANGRWPDGLLDHRSRVRDENRVDNLREATRSQSSANRQSWGVKNGSNKGVTRRVSRKGTVSFQAQIQRDGRRVCIGTYSTAALAGAAYRAASEISHGEFAEHAARDAARKAQGSPT